MTHKTAQLEDVWPLVMGLSAADKMRLIERIAGWFEHQLNHPAEETNTPTGWGEQLVRSIQSGELDTSAWVAMDIPDSVQWLKDLRREESLRGGEKAHAFQP